MKRVAIVGLGGVGGYLAANLSKTEDEIVGFARGQHLQAIQKNKITIVEDNSRWSSFIDARTLSDADGYFDIVIFCVKSYDLLESYNAIKNHIDANSVIVSFANGVSNGDTLREISDSFVLDGCIYILSHIKEYGVIEKKGKVFTSVFGGDAKATKLLATLFEKANLKTITPANIQKAIWKKYIFISAFATLTSFYDKSINYVYTHHYEEVKITLLEIASVAKVLNIEIEKEVEKALDIAKGLPAEASTSMHLDFQQHKKVELDTLCNYIILQAQTYNVKVPQMQMMYSKLKEKVCQKKD